MHFDRFDLNRIQVSLLKSGLITICFSSAWNSQAQKGEVGGKIRNEIENALARPPRIGTQKEVEASKLEQLLVVSHVAFPYCALWFSFAICRPHPRVSLKERSSYAALGATW